MNLTLLPHQTVDDEKGTSGGHQSSPGNPDRGQAREDEFAAGIVAYLNKGVLDGEIADLVIIAPPRALGEMRKHYHKALTANLQQEIAKELTGHSLNDIEKAVAAA